MKKTLQKSFLTDSGIKQNLKSLCKYYPENERIQVLFLLKTVKTLSQISSAEIRLIILGNQYNVKMEEISKFRQHSSHLKEFLMKEIKVRKSEIKKEVNIEKEIVKFICQNSYTCLQIDEKSPEKINVIKDLS